MNSNEDMERRTTGQEKTDKDVSVKPIEEESTSSENEKENCHDQAEDMTENITEEKQKSKKRIWSLIIAIFGCSVCIAIFFLLRPSIRYKNAMSAYEQGNYAEALETFVKLGDYKEAQKQTVVSLEGYIGQILEQGDYEKAYQIYIDTVIQEEYKPLFWQMLQARIEKWNEEQRWAESAEVLRIFKGNQKDELEDVCIKTADELLRCEDFAGALSLYNLCNEERVNKNKTECEYQIAILTNDLSALYEAAKDDYKDARERFSLQYSDSKAFKNLTCKMNSINDVGSNFNLYAEAQGGDYVNKFKANFTITNNGQFPVEGSIFVSVCEYFGVPITGSYTLKQPLEAGDSVDGEIELEIIDSFIPDDPKTFFENKDIHVSFE